MIKQEVEVVIFAADRHLLLSRDETEITSQLQEEALQLPQIAFSRSYSL